VRILFSRNVLASITSSRRKTSLSLIALGLLVTFAASPAQAANPVPLLAEPLLPAATAPGGPAFTLTVNGTGFVSGAVVNWNGSARTTTFVSSSQLTAAITAADIATAQTAVITATNPAPGGGTSNPEYFQVTNPTVGLAFNDSLVLTQLDLFKPVVADFNGDGKLDIAVIAQMLGAGSTVQLLLGNGDGTFQSPPISVTVTPSNTTVQSLAAGDFNGDGKVDLVATFFDNNTSQFGISVALGNGNGTFQAPVASLLAPGSGTNMILVADVNGDGILDIVRAKQDGISVELGNGDGTFRHQFTYTTPSCAACTPNNLPVASIALGDVRKTGKLDIIAAIETAYVAILPGNGEGTFGPPSLI